MVSKRHPINSLRSVVPILGVIALIALFLMLPESPGFGCKTCSSNGPYIPLIGAGYFSVLIGLSLLFPTFSSRSVARGGLTWAVALAVVLTYMRLPGWCLLCLIGHVCHIAIWTIWAMVPPLKSETRASSLKERFCLLIFAPVSVIALFCSLNLTFMAYGFKIDRPVASGGLQIGDPAPAFTEVLAEGASSFVVNFVSADCPYCKEQLAILGKQFEGSSFRIFNVSPELSDELISGFSSAEWIEDTEGSLRKQFKVSGYPTLFVVGVDGKISRVIAGVSDELKKWQP